MYLERFKLDGRVAVVTGGGSGRFGKRAKYSVARAFTCATLTSLMLLMADCRLVWLVVSMVLAKPRRLCSAPLVARSEATSWMAAVTVDRDRLPKLAADAT